MDTKSLERSIKTIIKTGDGYGPEFKIVLRDTKKILKRINKGKPTAENYFSLGNLCLKLEDSHLALEAFLTGYKLNPSHTNCGTYCALLLEQQERWAEALNIYKALNAYDKENILIVERMLLIFYQLNDIKEVLNICSYFLEKKLYYAVIYDYISKVYYDCGNVDKAIDHLNNALMLDKNNNDYVNRIIHHLYKNKDYEDVLKYEEYLEKSENTTVEIRLLFANALAHEGEITKARNYFVNLLRSQTNKTKRFSILTEISIYHMNFEIDYRRADFLNDYILKREPNNIHALTNRAITAGKYALANYEKVIKQYPDDPLYRMNYGYRLLQLGHLKKGFEFYESRVDRSLPFLTGRLTYPEEIKSKKLFVWNEQGIGDQYIWSWLFRCLEQAGVKAHIQTDERLVPMMNRSFPSLTFTGETVLDLFNNEDFKQYDAEIVVVSIGKYFIPEIKQSQLSFEEGQPQEAHLKADIEKIAYWKKALAKQTIKQSVGICWRSGVQGDLRDLGYLTVENVVEIFEDLDCYVVNLQYDYTEEEITFIKSKLGERFITFSDLDLKNDQEDIAALMCSLSLVFSVATAVQALAGCLGVKTLCPGKSEFLGKLYNIMSPSVERIVGPSINRENSSFHQQEIIKALS